jgi:hypothetical protein
MNEEENGVRGGKDMKFNPAVKQRKSIFLLRKVTREVFTRGFSIEADEANFNKISNWATLFEPYLIHKFVRTFWC